MKAIAIETCLSDILSSESGKLFILSVAAFTNKN